LKGVEREIEVAGKEVVERGIGGGSRGGPAERGGKVFARRGNPEGPVQQYLQKNRIGVTRAPTGMSRQRMNQTRCTK
jgi:hypothetical protein